MELYLQFGYGMMEHSRTLISQWRGGTVILSPRDLNGDQLQRLANSIVSLPGGAVLHDPQCYLPNSDHDRLCSHDYWPTDYQTGTFWQGQELKGLLRKLARLNRDLSCREFILPGMYATVIDADWLEVQRIIIEEAQSLGSSIPLTLTIALSADAVRNVQQMDLLLQRIEEWDIKSYYIVCEHPNGKYLVEDPIWLANILDLVSGIRLAGARAILGYCNHQMLIAATAKVNAIASGTWMNVRSFPPDKFRSAYDDEIKQRSVWYYAPQALSEYKLPFLDIAFQQNLLNILAPPSGMASADVARMFSGPQPSTIGFSEQSAFRHYLNNLRAQCLAASGTTFEQSVHTHESLLNDAENLLNRLYTAGIRGQLRDFKEIIDVNRAALISHQTTRGAILRRRWANL